MRTAALAALAAARAALAALALIPAGATAQVPAQPPFSVEDVLSSPFPSGLVA
jgi:hypothetical protein